jgi:phosphohistidine swiveling domain-containing protein
MAEHPLADPKWTLPEVSPLSALTRRRVMETIQRNLAGMGDVAWSDVVSDRTMDLFSAEDGARVARQVAEEFMAESGRKLLAGAEIAVREQPDLYILRSDWMAAQDSLEGLADLEADALGLGDNVFATDDVEGEIIVIRQVGEVDRLMREGVPEGAIGLIDDAGGTLTAPILPEFAAVLCRAGTVRSHLAIIAREYGVPTLMSVQLRRELVNGERVKVQYSAAAQGADAYHGGETAPRARIWSA